MGVPFLNRSAKKRDQIVAVDLGGRQSKAVHIQRRGEKYSLLNFAIQNVPTEKQASPQVLADQLTSLTQELESRTKLVSLALGANEALLRHAEMPMVPVADLRAMLKFNSKTHLQQDLPDHIFDCQFVVPTASRAANPASKGTSGVQNRKVLVGGATKQVVENLQTAARSAGLIPEQIVPGLIGPANAFEMAEPEIFAKEIVALVDIGFRSTNICVLNAGELILNRLVAIGGDHLTNGLAESLGIGYAEAEGIKVGMPTEVQHNLEPLITPLGRELRASLDFFEHQQDKTVSQVFISGASARGEFIVTMLQTELMVPCKTWNPVKFLQISLPPQKMAELDQFALLLTTAVGTAVAAL
jgi:type IV pilus assembly protein PilM